MNRYYLTTAISYINGLPHLGHAVEQILADSVARYRRQCGEEVRFLTGTDEHSINILRKAESLGKAPQLFCDEMAAHFQALSDQLTVRYDRFIRTTDRDHIETVQSLLRTIHKNGYFRVGTYEGHYCLSCEAFYSEADLVNGRCKIHDSIEIEWIQEKNFFFRLAEFQGRLKQFLEATPSFIEPEFRFNEVMQMVNRGLQDISVSRANLQWGVPFPEEIARSEGLSHQTTYVWFDALINYLTGVGYTRDPELSRFWPADLHIIGKDISFFHCVIWPAMLMAADLPLPKKVFIHGFWLNRGEKMSKTKGNQVDPLDLIGIYGADALRFYLLSEGYAGYDANFSVESFEQRYSGWLANDLGNLLQRTLTMAHKFCAGITPRAEIDPVIRSEINAATNPYRSAMAAFRFHEAIESLWVLVRRLNKYIDERAPWAQAKNGKSDEVAITLRSTLEGLYYCGTALHPIMPTISAEICRQLNRAESVAPWKAEFEPPFLIDGTALLKPTVLFKKPEPA